MIPVVRSQVYAAIDCERDRQATKWGRDHSWGRGDCSSPDVDDMVKAAVLAEECGEVARAVLDKDPKHLVDELVQVAAVAVAWLEYLLAEAGSPVSVAHDLAAQLQATP